MRIILLSILIYCTGFNFVKSQGSGMMYVNGNLCVVKGVGDTLKVQPILVSGTGIKTVNSNSLIGSGDISITAGFAWGNATGTLSNQTDLNNALNAKANLASPAFTGTPTGIGIPVYARVTGSNATTTGQALADIAGLSIALTTNAVYEFEANMSASTSAVTTGIQYGVQYSVAGGAVEAQIMGSSTATAMKSERISALNTATTAYLTSSAQSGGVRISGVITTGANAGNLTIRHLKVTSGTSTVFINSFLKVIRIQ